MEIRQSFKFETMPSGENERLMRRFAGSCRFVYNKALATQQEMYTASGKKHTYFQLCKLLNQWKIEYPWLSQTPIHALQQSLKDLERAYTNFFEKRGAYPKFHKKGRRDAFRESDSSCIELDQTNSRIRLPKIGWVRYRKSREVPGTIKNVTVSSTAGKWSVSINTVREVEQPIHRSGSSVGVDFGVARFASLSDGTWQALPDTSRLEERRKFLQRRLKRKRKFSSNWKKLQAKIAKAMQRITNIRQNHRHEFTNTITKKPRRCVQRRLGSQEYVDVRRRYGREALQERAAESETQPHDSCSRLGRSESPTGLQDPMARWNACPGT